MLNTVAVSKILQLSSLQIFEITLSQKPYVWCQGHSGIIQPPIHAGQAVHQGMQFQTFLLMPLLAKGCLHIKKY